MVPSPDLGSDEVALLPRQAQDALWLQRLGRDGLGGWLPAHEEPPRLFSQAIEEFNAGNFTTSNHLLRAVWRETPYPLRLFYYALIKAAVGFVHIQRHNRLGACNQLRVAEAYLRPFLPSFLGVQTVLLWQEVGEWLRRLQENLPSWKPLDELPRPRILYTQA